MAILSRLQGRESEAHKRAEALKRQQARAEARKHAQLKAQTTVAREQKLADNTWDDADSDFQVRGDEERPRACALLFL